MLRFMRDMAIGWIVYTKSGRQTADKIVKRVCKNVKKRMAKSQQFQEIKSLADIFLKDDDDERDEQE